MEFGHWSLSPENMQAVVVWTILIFLLGLRFYRFRRLKKFIGPMVAQGATVIDVRNASEYARGARPGSLNIPLKDLTEALTGSLKDLDHDKPVIVCCATGSRSAMAIRVLRSAGFTQVLNAGSWKNTL